MTVMSMATGMVRYCYIMFGLSVVALLGCTYLYMAVDRAKQAFFMSPPRGIFKYTHWVYFTEALVLLYVPPVLCLSFYGWSATIKTFELYHNYVVVGWLMDLFMLLVLVSPVSVVFALTNVMRARKELAENTSLSRNY